MAAPRNVFYAQAGGATAVINASAAAVIETCRRFPGELGSVLAGHHGILGLIHEDLIDTSQESAETIRELRHTPGAAFGSARFRLAAPEDDPRTFKRIVDVLAAHDIGYVLYNGGNGSADTTLQLSKIGAHFGYPLTCVHIPKTIDNDIPGTDSCPGFGSAAKYLAVSLKEAAADVASMATTSTRVFILEAMGRHAGWMVAAMGLAGGDAVHPPHLLLFAEVPFLEAEFLARVEATVQRYGYCVVGASEGLRTPDGDFLAEIRAATAGRNEQLGGVAPRLAALVHDRLGFKCHWATADYLQRSARHLASAVDIAHAEAVASTAVEMALAGRNGTMATLVRDSDLPYRWHVGEIALEGIAARERTLPRSFIANDGLHISESCRRYLLPLIQGEPPTPFRHGLPAHARLAGVRVPKRLAPWTPD